MFRNHFKSHSWTAFVSTFILVVLLFSAGCGGGGSATPGPTPAPTPSPSPATSAAQVRLGDSSVDSIIDFEFTMGTPMIFTMSGATGAVSVTVSTNRFEMSHMAAKMEPMAVMNVPQGSYVSAQLTIQNPELTYMTGSGTPVSISGAPSTTVIIPMSPALTIGASPMIVNIDVNVANCISASGGSITGFNITPSCFNFSLKPVAAENMQQDDTGEVEGLVGKVSSISGSNFTLDLTSGAQLVFATDNTTQYQNGLTNLTSALNQIVKVEGITRTDGSLFAKELEGLESMMGSELDGILTLVTGNPATSLTFLAQDGMGNGMDMAKMGAEFSANVNGLSNSKYNVYQGKCDYSGLSVPGPNFPFDSTTIHAGQRIEVENTSGVPAMMGSFTADKVTLEQQAIRGTVANFTPGTGGAATFDLTLPSDSFLTTLSGQTVVHVFQQPATNNVFGPIANTNQVRVRGLLFWTGTTFNMIARRITAP